MSHGFLGCQKQWGWGSLTGVIFQIFKNQTEVEGLSAFGRNPTNLEQIKQLKNLYDFETDLRDFFASEASELDYSRSD